MLGLSAIGEWPPLFEAEASVTGLPAAVDVAVTHQRSDIAATHNRNDIAATHQRPDLAPA